MRRDKVYDVERTARSLAEGAGVKRLGVVKPPDWLKRLPSPQGRVARGSEKPGGEARTKIGGRRCACVVRPSGLKPFAGGAGAEALSDVGHCARGNPGTAGKGRARVNDPDASTAQVEKRFLFSSKKLKCYGIALNRTVGCFKILFYAGHGGAHF